MSDAAIVDRRESHPVLVEMNNMAKVFGRAVVLADVDLQVRAGEVHGLLGENGAGKSTLTKILAGVYQPDGGTIQVDGRTRSASTVQAARDEGIAMVYQELSLVPQLTVAQNLALGREGRHLTGTVHDRDAERRANTLLEEFDTRVRPTDRVANLRFAERQITEILKALFGEAKVLVLDEPTASLTPREQDSLFSVIRRLKTSGVGVVYISHRLGEVLEITDRVTVLRNGRVAGLLPTSEATVPMLVEMMSGVSVDTRPSYHAATKRDSTQLDGVVLDVTDLGDQRKLTDVSLQLARGEVLGLTGLVGSGRSTLLRCLFGLERVRNGRMTLLGERYHPRNAHAAIAAGVALVPEDRREQGIFPGLSVEDNLTIGFPQELAAWPAFRGLGPLSRRARRSTATGAMQRLKIKAQGPKQQVGVLSGGTQQKIVFGKWLIRRPKLLLLDEPTAGVDVSTKNEIWPTVRQLADDGVGVIYSSSDAEELAAISDRILVLCNGRVAGELRGDEAHDEDAIRQAIQTLSGGVTQP